ncbi:MAG: site-specific integrase [Clostridia bacterium]|nr:site-specific integrase [Clostridia bacterium]
MEKINFTTNNTMQKINTCTKDDNKSSTFYRIRLFNRPDRHDARISLPIFKGGVNPRISASSSISKEEAIIKLLDRIKIQLIEGIDQKVVGVNNLFFIFDNISASIHDLEMQTNTILTYFHNIVSCIYGYLNTHIIAPVAPQVKDSVLNNNQIANTNIYVSDKTNQIQPAQTLSEILSFKEVAIKWFHYKKSFTIKTEDNPNPLSKKTLQGYNKMMNLTIIPFFEKNDNIDNISNERLQECIDSTNGARHKEAVYIVLKMIIDYARDNNYIGSLRTIKKPKKPKKNSKLKIEGHDFVYIESSRQSHWLDCFEKENTDSAYLFEAMLLEGLRPEEACGLNWKSLVEDNNYFIINNAFKDFPVYNDEAEIIGHVRQYDTLKTDESYRKIPIHPRYREILIKHKENQKQLFKKLKLKWSENTPIFLNRYHQPYVPENLPKALKTFREKYNLENLTPYGLRHSFATFMSEQGMRDIVLMKLMGHADFSTTQKYYIFVSDERKKQEYELAWKLVSPQDNNIIETENKNELELNNIMIKEFKQLQQMWIQTVSNFMILQQKNNTN